MHKLYFHPEAGVCVHLVYMYMYLCFNIHHEFLYSKLCNYSTSQSILHDHFTDCSLMELWDLPAAGVTLLSDTTLLGDAAAQYPSCDDGSVGSVVLENITLNTATVAYYTGTTPGSSACFVCDEGNGYVPNTPTTAERFCQHNAMWSGSPVVCGKS